MTNLYFRCRIVTQTCRANTAPGTPLNTTAYFPDPIMNALPFELAGAASRMGNYMIPDDTEAQIRLYLRYVGQRVLWGPGTPPPPATNLDVEWAVTGHREVQGVWVQYGDKSYIFTIKDGANPFETTLNLPGVPGGPFKQKYFLVFDPV